MKKWIVRFASLLVFNIVVLLVIGFLTPARVGWSALWAGIVMAAFAPLFAALYPLTQIYQLDEDRADIGAALALGVSAAAGEDFTAVSSGEDLILIRRTAGGFAASFQSQAAPFGEVAASTALVTLHGIPATGETWTVTLGGVAFSTVAGALDTVETLAATLAGTLCRAINDSYGHITDGAETDDRESVSEWWMAPRQTGPGAHHHEDNDEVFYVLEGTTSFLIGDTWIDADKGTFLRIPAKTMHDFANRTSKRTGVLNFYTPGGFERNMEDIVQWFDNKEY